MILLLTIIAVVLIILIVLLSRSTGQDTYRYRPPDRRTGGDTYRYRFEPPERRAGRMGEEAAANIIRQVLRRDDVLLNNIAISYDGRHTELDNVIINRYGVFIIEVKNYRGILIGTEDDYEWEKYKNDGYGNIFEKKVKNPIKQVRRQIYILANYLRYHGIDVWAEGYAMLLRGGSPVESPHVLASISDIDRAVHTFGRKSLSPETMNAVINILS